MGMRMRPYLRKGDRAMSGQVELKGPDFAKDGIAATDIAEGAMSVGRADGEASL